MGSRKTLLYGFVGLTFVVAACSVSSKKSNDDDDGGTSTGTGTSAVCATACQKLVAANCPGGTDQPTCVSDCEADAAAVTSACREQYDAVMSCGVARGTVACDAEGVPELEGCDAELQTYIQCAVNAATSSSASTSASTSSATSSSSSSGTGGSTNCYAGHGSCDPLTPSCATGEACDIDSTSMFQCFPPPNTAGVGQACDNSAGPYCQHGLACDAAVCREYCCTAADCTTGTCQQVGTAGSIVISVCK